MPEYMALVKYTDVECGDDVCFASYFADNEDDMYGKVNDCVRYDRRTQIVAEEYYHRVDNRYEKIA
jgi:hypothetical protein